MGQTGADPDATRKLLKIFGVKVTDYGERTRNLLHRAQAGTQTPETRQALLQEAAELSADLNHWLREITNHVLTLQSDFLRRLVAEGSPPPPQ